jgi:hypothetical protein
VESFADAGIFASTYLASHFSQPCSTPQAGQLEVISLSGRLAKVAASRSSPVDILRPVLEHLTMSAGMRASTVVPFDRPGFDDQAIFNRPLSLEIAPYLSALVVSSCRTCGRVSACRDVRVNGGPCMATFFPSISTPWA